MATAAYEAGDAWVDALRRYLAGNAALFDAGIAAIPGLRPMPLDATYLAWVDFSGTGMAPGVHRPRRAGRAHRRQPRRHLRRRRRELPALQHRHPARPGRRGGRRLQAAFADLRSPPPSSCRKYARRRRPPGTGGNPTPRSGGTPGNCLPGRSSRQPRRPRRLRRRRGWPGGLLSAEARDNRAYARCTRGARMVHSVFARFPDGPGLGDQRLLPHVEELPAARLADLRRASCRRVRPACRRWRCRPGDGVRLVALGPALRLRDDPVDDPEREQVLGGQAQRLGGLAASSRRPSRGSRRSPRARSPNRSSARAWRSGRRWRRPPPRPSRPRR